MRRAGIVCLGVALAACAPSAPSSPCVDGTSTGVLPIGRDEALADTGCPGLVIAGDPPPPYELTLGGRALVLRGGFAWEREGDRLCRIGEQPERGYYEPPLFDDFASAFVVQDCALHRRADDGSLVAVGPRFDADFEGVDDVCSLLGPEHRFTAMTLQSPRAPEVADYVALRQRVCNEHAPFLDNTLTVTAEAAHEGTRGLRSFAVAQDAVLAAGAHPSKASVESELVHFVRGDVATIDLWLRVVDGLPLGLVDLETTFVTEHPGPRLLVTEDGHLEGELKWGDRPRFPSLPGASAIPIGRWFHLVVELALEPDDTGHLRVTLDDEVVIDADGQTLPLPNTILNSLELGLTSALVETTLDVDDVHVR
ncbi:MAG: hypothetical protein U0353_31610 [Sandaracinus sp.]